MIISTPQQTPNKVLIMKFRNIGDVLLITPLIKSLKQHFPDALIDVAVNDETKEMVTLNPNIHEIISYNRQKIKSKNIFKKVLAEIRFGLIIRAKRYDIIINTTKGDRGAQIALISGAKTKIGYKNPNFLLDRVFDIKLPLHAQRHMVDVHLDSLKALNLPIKEKKVEIFWSKNDEKKVDELLECKNFVHIHPVSRWMFKCINDQSMAELIDYCKTELKKEVVITAAPIKHEQDRVASILKLCNTKPINLSGKLTLKQTAALNKRADFFLGVDTAIMHISAANDVPVVAFFGPSSAFHWGPWDNELQNSLYNKTKGDQTMGKHTVIQKDWECVPCNKAGCNGSEISDCLMEFNLLSIKEILKNM